MSQPEFDFWNHPIVKKCMYVLSGTLALMVFVAMVLIIIVMIALVVEGFKNGFTACP